MARSMKREEAIRLLAEVDLSLLSPEERAEQLETMMCEDWESHREWSSLSSLVRQEFAQQREIDEPCASRYDPVLLLWLTYGYAGVRNDFLLARLREVGHQASAIEGEPASLEPCPCCGFRTLGSRGNYEICPVCWWEDDGQDNDDASMVKGGPNAELNLVLARANFLKEGIADPSREDLRRFQEPALSRSLAPRIPNRSNRHEKAES